MYTGLITGLRKLTQQNILKCKCSYLPWSALLVLHQVRLFIDNIITMYLKCPV